MRTFRRLAVSLALVVMTAGCSARVVVRELASGPPAETIEGIPIRIAARQHVTVFMLQPDNTYGVVYETNEDLPDQSRVFALGIDADWLSDHKLVLELDPNGTVKKVETTSTSKAEAALAQVGASTAAVATAVESMQDKLDAAKKEEKEKDEEARKAREAEFAQQEALLLAYRAALEAVFLKEAEIAGSGANDLPLRESELRVLKLKANQAARRIGRSPPYPSADDLP